MARLLNLNYKTFIKFGTKLNLMQIENFRNCHQETIVGGKENPNGTLSAVWLFSRKSRTN